MGPLIPALLFAAVVAAQPDPVAEALGGIRGHVIGRASKDVAKNGEGSTIRLRDGSLLHAFSRHMRPTDHPEKYPNPDLWPAHVAVIISRDSGRTWTEPAVLFTSTTGENAMQPSFTRMANGEIGVSYSRIDSIAKATKVFRYSRDEGKTWSDEILISPSGGYWTSAHDRMITLSGGRVLLTLHNKERVKPERIVTQVGYSDDHGRTWKLSPQRLVVEDVIPENRAKYGDRAGFWEGSIAERADGSLFMIGRTYTGWLYGTESSDRGVNWSAPRPTSLPSGAAPGRLERIPESGDLLVIWNSCCIDPKESLLGRRITLSAAISQDGGKTWRWRRELETITPEGSNRIEYPAMNIYDKTVYVTYRAQTGSGASELRMQEYFRALPLSWFYALRDYNRPETALPAAGASLRTAAEIEHEFATLPSTPPTNREILAQPHHTVKVARVTNRNGPLETQAEEDRVFHVLSGSARMRVANGSGFREVPLAAGSVLSIPRGVAYQILAEHADVSMLVVTIR